MSAPENTIAAVSLPAVFLQPFMKLASVQPGERVLDLACGTGEAALASLARTGASGELLALDRSSERLAHLVAQARERGLLTPQTAAAGKGRLPSPDSYWDAVICHLGLPELADPHATFADVIRVLRPVGRMAVSAFGERERCPLVTIFLDAIARDVPAAAGEAKELFQFSATGQLATLLADCGFQDAVPERTTEWVRFRDVDHYWESMCGAMASGRPAAALPEPAIAACKAEIAKKTRFYQRGGGIELKVEVVILAVVK